MAGATKTAPAAEPAGADDMVVETPSSVSIDEKARLAEARARVARMRAMQFPEVTLVSVKNNPGLRHFDVIVGTEEVNPCDETAPRTVTHGTHYHFIVGVAVPVNPDDVEFLLDYPTAKFVLAAQED